jgi:hypothetical protein
MATAGATDHDILIISAPPPPHALPPTAHLSWALSWNLPVGSICATAHPKSHHLPPGYSTSPRLAGRQQGIHMCR